MREAAECVTEYCRHGDSEAFARLVADYRPMVAGICRRYVIEPGDVEDAVQETFVKLSRRAGEVTGDVGAWLCAVAGTTALDYARRSLRERARLKRLAMALPPAEQTTPSRKVMEMRLQEALAGLDPAMRSLVMARFFTGEAVKELAKKSRVDGSTMSRRVARAVARVRASLEKMGYRNMEDLVLSAGEMIGRQKDSGLAVQAGRVRVGVLLSHQTSQLEVNPFSGLFHEGESHQLRPMLQFPGDKYQLIAILEPGSEDYGYIENDVRSYGIIGGVVEATDAEGLKTLDVIVVGHAYAVTGRLIDAIVEAVESGVGLYHEGFLGSEFPGLRDPRLCRLMLTDKFSMYHTPGAHNLPRPATVVAAHPVLEGVSVGAQLEISGCGAVFVPRAEGARVLMYRDELVDGQDPPIADLKGLRSPALMVGKVGRGRVVMVGMRWTSPLQDLPGMRGKFEHNAFAWLAEERLAERKVWAVNG